MNPTPEPLSVGPARGPVRLFRSRDLEETRAAVGRIFKPHDLGVLGQRQQLDASMDHLPLGKASINRLRYGANVSIEPDCLDDFLLVQMPLQGTAQIRCGDQAMTSSPQQASVITPSLPLHMQWQGQCDQLIVRLERTALESACSALLGYPLAQPIAFELGMDLRQGPGLSWKSLIEFLASPAYGSAVPPQLVGQQIEQLLITTLLTQHPHSYTQALMAPARQAPRRYVLRAEDYILNHYAQPITIDTLARHANISARSLHKGFQEYMGMSPMAFLKQVRLRKVHEQLLLIRRRARPAASITQLAIDAGFTHLGHFSKDYREQFGETPSETAGFRTG